MNKISPVSATTPPVAEVVAPAAAKRSLAAAAKGVSETVNGEANARATATRFRASVAGSKGVGSALDLVG